jgi:hypothetical protein
MASFLEWNGGFCQNEKSALRQVPLMFEGIGWGARIRTWEWRNQNPSEIFNDSNERPEIWSRFFTFSPFEISRLFRTSEWSGYLQPRGYARGR